MKILKILIILLFSNSIFGQENLCRTDILNGRKINSTNLLKNYIKYDFSELWTFQNNSNIYGIIGNENQRILIKLLTVEKNIENPIEYFVYGKTSVKENVCEFVGKITIVEVQEFSEENFGVDDEYKNTGIQKQGLISAKYEFYENKNQKHSGYFSGILKSKFYLDKDNLIKYNDINFESDGYFNNSFVGKWKKYNSKIEKVCNWGDFRVPNSDCDFDIGVGEFNVAEKYHKNGWIDIVLARKVPSFDIIESRPPEGYVAKEWWE